MNAQPTSLIPEDLVDSVLSRVFETMFFAECESFRLGPVDPNLAWTQVAFQGGISGFVAIGVTEEFARGLSCDFLGLSPDEAGSDSLDLVLLELANVICGSTLSTWHPNSLFEIKTPERCSAPQVEEVLTCSVQENCVQVLLAVSE